MMRKAIARITGPPSSTPRNTERRDHSICPSDKSKMRNEAVTRSGACRGGLEGFSLIASTLDEVLEDGLEIVVGRRDLVDRAGSPGGRELGQPRVERVGPSGLH